MANGAINWFHDEADDALLGDAVPSFEGGQFSNLRANLLQPNQSKLLGNCDIDRLGKLRTRRGTIMLGTGPPSGVADTTIQGLTSYQTPENNYVVAANNRKIWKYTDGTPGTWARIATGGAADNDEIIVFRTGAINNAGGYAMGTTVLTVDAITGFVAAGEKLYFLNNLKNDYFEYTIASVSPAAPAATTQITLEEPGLVFDVADNWVFVVARTAKINHAAYAGGYSGVLTIDNFTGSVNAGEFSSSSPRTSRTRLRRILRPLATRHPLIHGRTSIPSPERLWPVRCRLITWQPMPPTPIVFAQGNDALYFCDGLGPIYGWNGKTVQNLSAVPRWIT